MLDKLFKIEKYRYHYKVTILGIKISVKSLKLKIEKLEKDIQDLALASKWVTRGRLLFYNNADRWTTEEKKWYLQQECYIRLGYYPNLRNPKSFNEKMNWMKFNYFDPHQAICVDKYEFKKYITDKLGAEYVIPVIAVYDSVDDINLDELPDKFVIKTTNGYGGLAIKVVKDKKKFNLDKFKYDFSPLLMEWKNLYYYSLERDYLEIKPRIIIEEYKEEVEGQLYDYKFFCFHGEPKFVYVAIDHFPGVKSKISLFDLDWNKLPVQYDGHPQIPGNFKKPKNYDKMLELSRVLAKDFPLVRVDFYEVGDRIYVGELTFTSGGAFSRFVPREWDYKLGEYLDLDKLPKQYVNVLPEFMPKENRK